MRYPARIFLLSLLSACGTAVAASSSPAAPAAPKFTLLARSKAPEPITLLSISAGEPGKPGKLVYIDTTGAEQTRPLAEIVALAPPSWVPTPETTGPTSDEFGTSDLPVHRLDLTDGERFVGELSGTPAKGSSAAVAKAPEDAVYLRHERLGLLVFPLDRVTRYWSNARRSVAAGARPFSTTSDTILLGNAERLEGLVTRIGPEVSIEIATPGAKPATPAPRATATDIDIANIALVTLVNPLTPLRTLRIDLADGTVLAAEALAGDAQSGKLTFKAVAAGSRGMLVDLSQLASVVPDPSRITPLASLPIAAQKPAEGRIGASPAQVLADAGTPLAAADIVLPGPMSVEWTIPAGSASIMGYAQMDDRSFAWGDCTVIVTVVPSAAGATERELARSRLNAATPSLTISADLGTIRPGDTLRVRTESGERGPIQDRVVLRRMLLLTGPASN
jgi:hypothetical protein